MGQKKYKDFVQYKTPLTKYRTPLNNIRIIREKGSGGGEGSGADEE